MPPRSQVRRQPGQAPIIPEIAQAYLNDPRTRLAQQAVANGTDASPVAQGDYAWADALARTMQAGLGGFQDRRIREQYGRQDDQTVDERAVNAQRQLDALNAERGPQTLPPAPPPAPPKAPAPQVQPQPQAAAIAGALGAPAPAAPPVGPQTMPPAPQAPPQAMKPPMGPQTMPPGPAGLPMVPPPTAGGPQTVPPRPQPRPQPRGVAFTDPLAGTGRETSAFGTMRPGGRQHRALDLAAPTGTPVAAAAEGRVVRAWNDTANGGGNSVIIEHPDGSRTGYAHLAEFNVQRGDTVRAGQPIGAVGSTGRSTGPHLHFTARDPSGRRIDPRTLRYGAPEEPPADAPPQGGEQVAELPGVDVQGIPGAADNYGIAPEAMPNAPDPVGATRSRGLQASLELAAAGNPFESARSQTGITAGYDQQTDLDERAAARQNDLNMTGYRAALGRYGEDRSQIRSQRFGRSERLGGQEFSRDERIEGQTYQSGERQLDRNFQRDERIGGQQFAALESARGRSLTRELTELQVGSREELARQRRLATPAAMREQTRANEAVESAGQSADRIREFMSINAEENTGGIRERLPFGADTFGSPRLQRMEALGNQLAIDLSSQLKGALSDRDMQTVRNGSLNITRNRSANNQNGQFLLRALERGNEFQVARVEALARGDSNFTREWAAFRDSVPLAENSPSFDEWKASIPSYDAQGRPVR